MLFTSFTSHTDLLAGDQRRMTANLHDFKDLIYAIEWLTNLILDSKFVDLQECTWACIPKDNYFELVVCTYSF